MFLASLRFSSFIFMALLVFGFSINAGNGDYAGDDFAETKRAMFMTGRRLYLRYADVDGLDYELRVITEDIEDKTERVIRLHYSRRGDMVTLKRIISPAAVHLSPDDVVFQDTREVSMDPAWNSVYMNVSSSGTVNEIQGQDRLGLDFGKFFPVFSDFPAGNRYKAAISVLLKETEKAETLNEVYQIGENMVRINTVFRPVRSLPYRAFLERESIFDFNAGVLESSRVDMTVAFGDGPDIRLTMLLVRL